MANRPADLPEAFWNGETNSVNTAKINEMVVAHAAEQSRKASLPQKREDVSLDLPADFQLPDGIDFKWDPANPQYDKFRDLVVSDGIPQATATKLAALFAEIMVGDKASMQAFEAGEVVKLGANGPVRQTWAKTGLIGLIGETLATHLQHVVRTADGCRAVEAILAKFSSQGVATLNGGNREPPQPAGKVNDEQWAKMSSAERLNYTRQFDQSQFQKSA